MHNRVLVFHHGARSPLWLPAVLSGCGHTLFGACTFRVCEQDRAVPRGLSFPASRGYWLGSIVLGLVLFTQEFARLLLA